MTFNVIANCKQVRRYASYYKVSISVTPLIFVRQLQTVGISYTVRTKKKKQKQESLSDIAILICVLYRIEKRSKKKTKSIIGNITFWLFKCSRPLNSMFIYVLLYTTTTTAKKKKALTHLHMNSKLIKGQIKLYKKWHNFIWHKCRFLCTWYL